MCRDGVVTLIPLLVFERNANGVGEGQVRVRVGKLSLSEEESEIREGKDLCPPVSCDVADFATSCCKVESPDEQLAHCLVDVIGAGEDAHLP